MLSVIGCRLWVVGSGLYKPGNLIRFVFVVAILTWGSSAYAQPGSLKLHLLPLDASPEVLSKIDRAKTYRDSGAIIVALVDIVRQLQASQYLEAAVDTLVRADSLYTAFLHIGPAYRWAQLRNGNVDETFLAASGYRERLFRGARFSYRQAVRLQESLLEAAENAGYPFARVQLDSVVSNGGVLAASLALNKGPLITIRKIQPQGDARIAGAFLQQYLGIRPGMPYHRGKILKLRQRLLQLPYLGLASDPSIVFQDSHADILLPLQRRNASRFDFIIGVLPNSSQVGRLLITGSFNGELHNQFGLGERIYARFEQLRPQTQRLDLQFTYPYVLGLPFGVDLQFGLYKRDTNFIDLNFDVGVQYLLEGGNYLKAFWNRRSTNVLGVNAVQLINSGVLPDTLDVNHTFFGLEYAQEQLDYRYNPRKGWRVWVRAGAGVKRIEKNNQIESLGFGELYDSLALRSSQYRLSAVLEGYLPLFKRGVIKTAMQGGYIFAGDPVYANEQYRLGGNRLLRGFDEELIFATQYLVGTLEYRFLLGTNSYLYLFGDIARTDNRTANTPAGATTIDFPYGFGAGITFETRAGLFGVSLAFGARQELPVDFGAPKVHFGYVSRF